MKIIEIVIVDGKKVPAEPFPDSARRIVNDGTKYIIYEDGDELPPIPQPTEQDKQLAAIDNELASLDILLPRSVEDLAVLLNVSLESLPEKQRALYSRKAELRNQRQELKG